MLLVFKKTHRLAKSQEKNFVKKKWRKHKKFMNGNKGEIPKPLNPRTSGREEKRDAFKEKKKWVQNGWKKLTNWDWWRCS